MSCPFVGLATRYTAGGDRLSVRICAAVPYERGDDIGDLPLPSVCFSSTAYQQCYHYRTLIKRKEIAARFVGETAHPVAALPVYNEAEVVPFHYDAAAPYGRDL